MDGAEILLKTHVGFVSAWFCDEEPTNDSNDNGSYDWVCYDDMFTLEHDDSTIVGWLPLPNHSDQGPASAGPSESRC